MHVTMVKKRLGSGEPCRKCVQAQDMLERRGLWEQVDEVVWAVEGDLDSAGYRLAAAHGVAEAPFFVVRDDAGETTTLTSVIQLKRLLKAAGSSASAAQEPAGAVVDPAAVVSSAQALDERDAAGLVRVALEAFGADCALAFSGAEDVYLVHLAARSGLPFRVFCLDTGRLHAETYRFLDRVRGHYALDLEIVTPDRARLEPFVRHKGLFSFFEDGHKECCGIRKVDGLRRTLATTRAWVTGQRRDQSPATRDSVAVASLDGAFEGAGGAAEPLVKLNPLAAWSSADVWAAIRAEGVPFNPLHERGFVSIGCEPCTRPVNPGQHEREGRWWWEDATKRECGLHLGPAPVG